MPKRNIIDPQTNLTPRQKVILFALIREYCDTGQSVGSKELKDKFDFEFSSATIRNELARLRDLGYLYQPFVNSSSKPTEKAFKLFIDQLIMGLQVTSKQQQDLKKQILEMQAKQTKLSKELSRLVAIHTGGVGFAVHRDDETVAGIGNLLAAPSEGKISDILEFLDNLDNYKGYLLEHKSEQISQNLDHTNKLKAFVGEESSILPLGRGYAMVTTEVFLDNEEKAVVGLVTPVHLLAKEKNLMLLDALSKVLGRKDDKE